MLSSSSTTPAVHSPRNYPDCPRATTVDSSPHKKAPEVRPIDRTSTRAAIGIDLGFRVKGGKGRVEGEVNSSR
jgi:hypothetical protein